ncbi:hypothetical protein ACIRD0_37445 [Streptomyces microflavus]|uniref:hypothetical protein n=1 Tax=Streptomyces microflavus TaxID=1919 RepID=UPI00380C7919
MLSRSSAEEHGQVALRLLLPAPERHSWTGIRHLRNKCTPPTPLRTQGRCDPCDKGYEPSPDTYFTSTAPVTHRLAA